MGFQECENGVRVLEPVPCLKAKACADLCRAVQSCVWSSGGLDGQLRSYTRLWPYAARASA